jgi:hypothetical protein
MKKHLGLIGTIIFAVTSLSTSGVLWCGVWLSVSRHVAQEAWSSVLFGVAIAIVVGCIGFCLLGPIRKKWHFGVVYTILVAIILCAMLTIGLFPSTEGTARIIHQTAVQFMIYGMLTFVIFATVAKWRRMGVLLKILGITIVSYSIAIILSSLFWRFVYTDAIFIWEVVYVSLVFAFILTLNYTTPKLTYDKIVS